MITYNGELWEMGAVEVKSRPRPQASTLAIPTIEANVITGLGVSIEELTNYLRSQNLALVVSRNVTSRDKNDRQQPFNLKVSGSNTQSISKSGKVYDIARMEFFQGDLIRSYSNGNENGRRVLAQRMHSLATGLNPEIPGTEVGTTQIADDGSMAAFVPARRALSWQTTSANGTPVVRERYWVTFQPGEIRVCASCHGVNTGDQLGRTAPSNPPQALAQLIAHWKELPPPVFTPIPPTSPTVTPNPGNPEDTEYSLAVVGEKFKPGSKFTITAKGAKAESRQLKVAINSRVCPGSSTFSGTAKKRALTGKLPILPGAKIKFSLIVSSAKEARANASISLLKTKKNGKSRPSTKAACKSLLSSFR
jgi:hypothetical protein